MSRMGNTGQSLQSLDDQSLLELLLRDDLPGYLMDVYTGEADRRMAQSMVQMELAI